MNKAFFFIVYFLLCMAGSVYAQDPSVKRQIPLSKRGKPYSYYRAKPLVEKKLGLASIEDGADSIQIRIWYTYSFIDSSQLILLAKEAGEWQAGTIFFKYVEDVQKEGGYYITAVKEKLSVPQSGWAHFANELFELGIVTLPDMYDIENYPEMTDGDDVIVEVAQKGFYRIYSYKLPSFVQDQIREARKMEGIIKLLEKEFGFKPFREL